MCGLLVSVAEAELESLAVALAVSSAAEPVSFCTRFMKFVQEDSSTVVGTFLDGLLRFFFSAGFAFGLKLAAVLVSQLGGLLLPAIVRKIGRIP